ncbi:hypothetical protein BJV74DRAFT_856357 [Russula compacta]|nr:hypothetical protein BJV74DRAFT_856357 [Russula compacta]
MEDMATAMLARLASLHLKGFRQSPSMVEAAELFAAMRERSGRSIRLYILYSTYQRPFSYLLRYHRERCCR